MSLFKGWESLKNLKVGVIEPDFKQVPFVLQQTTHTYSESWGQVEKFFDTPWKSSWNISEISEKSNERARSYFRTHGRT